MPYTVKHNCNTNQNNWVYNYSRQKLFPCSQDYDVDWIQRLLTWGQGLLYHISKSICAEVNSVSKMIWFSRRNRTMRTIRSAHILLEMLLEYLHKDTNARFFNGKDDNWSEKPSPIFCYLWKISKSDDAENILMDKTLSQFLYLINNEVNNI